MTNEEKKIVANLMIENDWYSKTLTFIAKAYNIDNNTIAVLINGNKPEINEEVINSYVAKVDELLKSKEVENEKKE